MYVLLKIVSIYSTCTYTNTHARIDGTLFFRYFIHSRVLYKSVVYHFRNRLLSQRWLQYIQHICMCVEQHWTILVKFFRNSLEMCMVAHKIHTRFRENSFNRTRHKTIEWILKWVRIHYVKHASKHITNKNEQCGQPNGMLNLIRI